MYTRLRDLREDNDISQAECAKIGYISKNSYIRYENGERNPPLDVIVTYAKFYNVIIGTWFEAREMRKELEQVNAYLATLNDNMIIGFQNNDRQSRNF